MLEAHPLDCIGQLDVDAEIVGIEFQLVAVKQRRLLVDVHRQRGDVAVDREFPMAVARGLGLKIDPRLAVREVARRAVFGLCHKLFCQSCLARNGPADAGGEL